MSQCEVLAHRMCMQSRSLLGEGSAASSLLYSSRSFGAVIAMGSLRRVGIRRLRNNHRSEVLKITCSFSPTARTHDHKHRPTGTIFRRQCEIDILSVIPFNPVDSLRTGISRACLSSGQWARRFRIEGRVSGSATTLNLYCAKYHARRCPINRYHLSLS